MRWSNYSVFLLPCRLRLLAINRQGLTGNHYPAATMTRRTVAPLFLTVIVAGCLFFSGTAGAQATWETTLTAVGREFGGAVRTDAVVIGVGSQAESLPAPPQVLEFTVKMDLWALDFSASYYEEVKALGEKAYRWIIGIDPHGNVTPRVSDESCGLSWNPAAFAAAGDYELREGYEGTGPVVVPDMRTTTSYTVTSTTTRYFSLIYTAPPVRGDLNGDSVVGLDDGLLALKLLVGRAIPSQEVILADVNQDGRIALQEALYVLQVLSGLQQ